MKYKFKDLNKRSINKLYTLNNYGGIDCYILDYEQGCVILNGNIYDDCESIKEFLVDRDDLYDNFMDCIKNYPEYGEDYKVNSYYYE